jgi:cystathionine beta-lyase/cystathionine gamma-synthase
MGLGAAPDSRAMTRAARHVFWCAPTIVDTHVHLLGARIAEVMRPNTRGVFTESPGSLTFEVQDIHMTHI